MYDRRITRRSVPLLTTLLLASAACSDEGGASAASGGAGGLDAGEASTGEASAGAAGHGGGGGAAGAPDATSDAVDDAGLAPALLSETGLYDDIDAGTLAPGVREFTPEHVLWSDGAEKKRFLYLPPGGVIDTSDPDYWVFPTGTKAWKEFTREGRRVETRLLWKLGEGGGGWVRVAYLWNAEQTDATPVPEGATDAAGTPHDVPAAFECARCHDHHGDQLLGVGALQLDHPAAGVTVAALIAEGRLSTPPALPVDVPGSGVERAALGYFHANCGNCHNPRSSVFATVSMQLWLPLGSIATVAGTPTYTTTVGVPLDTSLPLTPPPVARITPGSPADSAVWRVMGERGNEAQMPPLASEAIDVSGRAAVQAFIDAL